MHTRAHAVASVQVFQYKSNQRPRSTWTLPHSPAGTQKSTCAAMISHGSIWVIKHSTRVHEMTISNLPTSSSMRPHRVQVIVARRLRICLLSWILWSCAKKSQSSTWSARNREDAGILRTINLLFIDNEQNEETRKQWPPSLSISRRHASVSGPHYT